jgi:3-oxoacyl-[acyl-carrier-protein] synthase II
MHDKIVITGIGAVTAFGTSVETILDSLQNGNRGIQITEVAGRRLPFAPVSSYEPSDFIQKKKLRRMDPANSFAIAAAKLALSNAGYDEQPELMENFGVIVGTGYSGFASVVEHQRAYLEEGIAKLTPIHFPNTVYNASAGMVAIELGLNGPNSTVTGLDVSGEFAISYGWMLVQQGMCERVVIVGVDDMCPALLEGLHDLGFASRDCEAPSEPLSKRRGGFVPGEGAGAIVIETHESATRRGAKIKAYIDGIGIYTNSDTVYSYSDKSESITRSTSSALKQANLDLTEIDWVSSAANGTSGLDSAEANAWHAMLNPSKHRLVTFKHGLGEFSASGVLRVALGIGCFERNRIPASLPSDPIDAIAAFNREGAASAGGRFLHHGLGLGGNSVSIIVSSPGAQHAN